MLHLLLKVTNFLYLQISLQRICRVHKLTLQYTYNSLTKIFMILSLNYGCKVTTATMKDTTTSKDEVSLKPDSMPTYLLQEMR